MFLPLSDDKHQMVRDSLKKCTGQCGCNSNPVATLPHAAVVFRMQPFNFIFETNWASLTERPQGDLFSMVKNTTEQVQPRVNNAYG